MVRLCICEPRKNCIVGGFLLIIYYTAVSYLMFQEIENSEITIVKDKTGEFSYVNRVSGFWVLGICFVIMGLNCLFLILGTINRRRLFIIFFLILQIIPMGIELFYLLVALMFGLEIEFVFIYLLPFLYVIYVDVVSVFVSRGFRKQENVETDPFDFEY